MCDCLTLSAENAPVQMGAEVALAERPRKYDLKINPVRLLVKKIVLMVLNLLFH